MVSLEKLSTTDLNAVLKSYLASANEDEALGNEQRLFDTLLRFEQEHRFVSGIIRQRGLGEYIPSLTQTVWVKLLQRLRNYWQTQDGAPIEDLKSYLAIIAYHVCDDHFRGSSPHRQKLKNQVNWVCTKTPGLARWQHPSGEIYVGQSAWQTTGQREVETTHWAEIEQQFRRQRIAHLPLAALVTQIFQAANAPLRLPVLVDLLARLLGVTDEVISPDDPVVPGGSTKSQKIIDTLPGTSPNPIKVLMDREQVRKFWEAICQLTVPQRRAFLLGWVGTNELPAAQIATFTRLADVLEFEYDQFAEVWGRIPLSDGQIAELLGTTANAVAANRERARRSLEAQNWKVNRPRKKITH